MPSERKQTIISPKGLITLPGPYRNYHKLGQKDGMILKWNKILVIYPEKMESEISKVDEFLIETLLEGRTDPDIYFSLFKSLSWPIRRNLLLEIWFSLSSEEREILSKEPGFQNIGKEAKS